MKSKYYTEKYWSIDGLIDIFHADFSYIFKHVTFYAILILLLFQVPTFAVVYDLDGAKVPANTYGDRAHYVDKEHGYYADGRGQVPEYARIAPPHEENIPAPRATKTVVPWERYYETNKQGYRPMGYQAPLVPNYNYFYSNRRNEPYTRADYVSVWCDGDANTDKGTCTTQDKVYYFYDVYHWSTGIAATQFRELKRTKDGKKRAYIFTVDDLGLMAAQMHGAKNWAQLFDMEIHFVTIDSYIPLDYLL